MSTLPRVGRPPPDPEPHASPPPPPLPPPPVRPVKAALRNLSDKMYERRKTGALEVERVARACASIPGDDDASSRALDALLDVLTREFAASARENHRKGGLIGLAAVIVGLGGLEDAAAGDLVARDARRSPLALGLSRVVPAVLAAFGDADARVRYYACEAMYNVVKVARTEILMGPGAGFLRAVFDALCVLAADSDANVQNASHLLDRLVKDVVSEGAELSRSGGLFRGGSRASSSGASSFDHPRRSFDAARALAPSIRAAIHATDPYVRQFLVGWISALDAAPDVDALPLLPDVLDGVLDMLADPNREIRQQADQALGEFLAEIRCARRRDEETANAVSAGAVSSDRDAAAAEDRGGGTSSLAAADLGRLTETLARRTRSPDEFTRVVAVTWLREFVAFAAGAARGTAREAILPRVPEVASAVLPCLSHAEAKVRAVAAETSEALLLAALEGVREGAGGDDRDRDQDRDQGVGGAEGAVEEDGTSEKKTSERTTHSRLSVRSLLDALASRLGESEGAATRREALRWFAALSDAAPRATRRLALGSAPRASEALLACLSHESQEVAASAATALAALGRDARGEAGDDRSPGADFATVVAKLARAFAADHGARFDAERGNNPSAGLTARGGGEAEAGADRSPAVDRASTTPRDALLRRRGALVVRRLCAALGPEPTLRELAKRIAAGASDDDDDDAEIAAGSSSDPERRRSRALAFAADAANALNLILLTAPECASVRKTLASKGRRLPGGGEKELGGSNRRRRALFLALYPCWCHSAPAALGLCVLTRLDAHAAWIARRIADGGSETELGVATLVQLDRFARLFETAPFAPARLRLIRPRAHPDLARCLYAVLATLPNGSAAFETLARRLGAAPVPAMRELEADEEGRGEEEEEEELEEDGNGGGWDRRALEATFAETRARHIRAAEADASGGGF